MNTVTIRTLGLAALLAIAVPTSGFACDACNQSLDDVAAPITHPTSFEDPRIKTEIRPIYVYHKIGEDFATSGGSAAVYALQLRYAVNDDLAIIATKDGYIDLNTDAVLDDQDGWADLSAGVKYAVHRNEAERRLVTVGLRYEIPTGEKEVFQGQGDGAFNPFVSATTALGPVNLMIGTGFRLALDDADSSFYDLDIHLDTKLGWFHPVFELGVYNVIEGGERLPIADEGEDFFNFGSSLASGSTLVSGAIGARFDVAENVSWGAAYQFPISRGNGSNILDYRVTTDLIFYFS